MNFEWAEGFRAPKGISAEAAKARLDTLPEPSPEASFEASKDPVDLLHNATWGEGDQAWANRARLDFHRHLIGAIRETVVVGGRTISIRSVEFVKTNGENRWVTLTEIRGIMEYAPVIKLSLGDEHES